MEAWFVTPASREYFGVEHQLFWALLHFRTPLFFIDDSGAEFHAACQQIHKKTYPSLVR